MWSFLEFSWILSFYLHLLRFLHLRSFAVSIMVYDALAKAALLACSFVLY